MGFEIPQIQEAIEATQSFEAQNLLLYLGSPGSCFMLVDISIGNFR